MVILFYSDIIGNAIQILKMSTKLREPGKGMLMTEAPKIKRKAGRPSLSSSHQTSDRLTTRSKFIPKGVLHNLPSTWWQCQ